MMCMYIEEKHKVIPGFRGFGGDYGFKERPKKYVLYPFLTIISLVIVLCVIILTFDLCLKALCKR